MYSDQRESSVFVNRMNKYVFKRDLNDSDGAHLTSFGIEFQTEEAKKMSDHQVLPYCVQVYWEEAWRISWSECCGCVMGFSAACQ